jgi:hypothetical protein
MRRTPLMAAVALAAWFALAGIAQATVTTSTFTASITPGKTGTTKAPKNVTFKANATIQTDDGSQPPQASVIGLGLDRSIVVNSKDFAVKGCTAAKLNSSKNIDDPACSKAKIGRSTSTAKVDQSSLIFDTRLYALSATKILVAVKQTSGIGCCGVFQAFESPIVSLPKPFGKAFNITIPPPLRQPLPGFYPSLTALNNVSIGATKRVRKRVKVKGKFVTKTVTVRFLSSTGCAKSKWSIRNVFRFNPTPKTPNPGPDLTKDTFSACRK